MQKFAANGLPHSWMMLRPPRSSSAPGTPLRNQFVAALLGAAGFRSRWGRHALQHHLGGGWCCLHRIGGLYRGARFFSRAVGPIRTRGSCPGACCVRRVAAQPYGDWLARGETRQRAKMDSHCGMRVQFKCACVRPDRGSLTSHQDKTASAMFGQCPPFTYNQPPLSSNVAPATSNPCHKVQGLQTAIT